MAARTDNITGSFFHAGTDAVILGIAVFSLTQRIPPFSVNLRFL